MTDTAVKLVPYTALETITPDRARELLSFNTHNRGVRQGVVNSLAMAISRGDWVLNGETIKIAQDGTILDGQHRLQAVIESDHAIETMVVYDLPNVAQDTVDLGIKRSVGDVLKLNGYKRGALLGATLRFIWVYQHGQVRATGASQSMRFMAKPEPKELMELAESYPDIDRSMDITDVLAKRFLGPQSMYAGLHAVFADIDPDLADRMFDQLGSGVGLELGSPVLALRRWLEERPRGVSTGSYRRVNPIAYYSVFVKCWNALRSGKQMKVAKSVQRDQELPMPM